MSEKFDGSKFNVTENENVFRGPHSSIDSVTLSAGEHSANLLRKKVEGYPIEFMDGPDWHTALKERGYPVIPTYRYDAENETEYLTDLRRGGTHQVIDFCSPENYEKVRILNMQELESEMEKLAEKSADDGLILHDSSIFFDIEKSTGIAKVILVDLREIGYERGYDGPPATREQVLQYNQAILKGHLDRLKQIAYEVG